MNINYTFLSMENMKAKLSTLWIFVMFNMTFADIIGFMEPGTLQTMMAGDVGFELTPAVMAVISLVQAIPIAMILFSRLLNYNLNRWANIIAGVITILYVTGGGNWDRASYMVFAAIEIVAMVFIIWTAWKWRVPEPA